MELIANYVDFYSVQSMSAILRWCDTAGTFVLQAVDLPARQQLLEQWSRYAVMRSIKIELYVHGLEWEDLFSNSIAGTAVTVIPRLTRIGKTSYTIQNKVTMCQTGQVLATVETVMVQLDTSLTKAVPLTCRDELQGLLSEPHCELLGVPTFAERPDIADCYSWQCEVRPSDCDLLGHMNNASYGTLFDDARHAAGIDCAVQKASIEYVLQAQAFQKLQIVVWRSSGNINLQMINSEGHMVSRAVMVPWPSSRL